MKDLYFERYAQHKRLINKTPFSPPFGTVVIPAYLEKDLLTTLESLNNTKGPLNKWEVIIVLNYPETASAEEKDFTHKQFSALSNWKEKFNREKLIFYPVITGDLPSKKAGVGMARKLGMDEAAFRLEDDGLIVCLDADCTVASNYFEALENHFLNHEECNAGSIYFEHDLSQNNGEAIYEYELFLRYFVQGQRMAGFPYAYHTVGSAMCARVKTYIKQGGMNTRKAGEDFYFINRMIKAGSYMDITGTTVYPSARESDRVPFGTGKAMKDWNKTKSLNTYHPKIFTYLHSIIGGVKQFYLGESTGRVPSPLDQYLKVNNFYQKIEALKSNSKDYKSFEKNFLLWFDGFQFMKMANYFRDEKNLSLPVTEAANILLAEIKNQHPKIFVSNDLLNIFRGIDKHDINQYDVL